MHAEVCAVVERKLLFTRGKRDVKPMKISLCSSPGRARSSMFLHSTVLAMLFTTFTYKIRSGKSQAAALELGVCGIRMLGAREISVDTPTEVLPAQQPPWAR
jgi:hypothetical protein